MGAAAERGGAAGGNVSETPTEETVTTLDNSGMLCILHCMHCIPLALGANQCPGGLISGAA